jgi:hypothetical protein
MGGAEWLAAGASAGFCSVSSSLIGSAFGEVGGSGHCKICATDSGVDIGLLSSADWSA